jgi:hypothetical protein
MDIETNLQGANPPGHRWAAVRDVAGRPHRRRGRGAIAVATGALLGSLLIVPAAIGQQGDAGAVAGNWAGTSYDITYDIPGDLTATFTQQTATTFTGTIYAVYPPELNPPETCTISSGRVSSTGAVRMSAQCRVEGQPAPDAAVIEGQLDSGGTVMSGTFHGAFHDEGTFTLTSGS